MYRLLVVVSLFFSAQGALNVSVTSAADYPSETHNVTTSDGYILGLQRIPYGRNSGHTSSRRKVVFLMHGLTFGSNSFTYAGPKYAIAYNLADAGYDVWMGNARGNRYSRRHVSLDPDVDSMKFFNFDYEDIAMHDLPAMFDYVLKKTGQDKFYYIGFSQGGTVFYVLNSKCSKYHSKIEAAHFLAGIGYENHFPNTNINLIAKSADVLYTAALLSGAVELASSPVSSAMLEILVGSKVPDPILVGASVRQLIQFFQNMRDKSFTSWNYGSVGNVAKYGSVKPPAYDLSKINIPVTIHYSVGDITQSEEDALAMVRAMPCAKARKVPRDDFKKMEYLLSKDAKKLVTNYIIESFKKS